MVEILHGQSVDLDKSLSHVPVSLTGKTCNTRLTRLSAFGSIPLPIYCMSVYPSVSVQKKRAIASSEES